MDYDELRKNIEQANAIEQELHEQKRQAALKRIKELRQAIRLQQAAVASANSPRKIPQ